MPEPTDIEHDTSRKVLTITWDDGLVSSYPMDYLRGWCPCAGCQGHGNGIRYHAVEGVTALRIDEVGAYALGFHFSDDHGTGIYSWDWLRKIASESPPTGYKTGQFDRGEFSE